MSIYTALAELEQRRESGALCVVVRSQGSTPRGTSSKMLVYADGRTVGTVGGGEMESRVVSEAIQCMRDGKPRLLTYNMAEPQRGDPGVCGGEVEIFVEPVLPKPILVVVGGGHVGKAVAHLAHWLGFWVVLSDDRLEFCSPASVPDADEFYPIPLAELPGQFRITPWTYIVLTTRSVDIDVPGLPGLLHSPAAYIGIIGSRRRWETTRTQLLDAGIPKEKLDGVHSPIGLDLGAETPEEIAVSIMAEIIQIRQNQPSSSGIKA
jgi:xanthine dehydrogenase accessory factor